MIGKTAAERLAIVKALIELSRVDPAYADLYLSRAETALGDLLSRQEYTGLAADRLQLPRVIADLRRAAEGDDWERVRAVADRAASIRKRLAAWTEVMPLADGVYGPRIVRTDGATLGLSGVISQPGANLSRLKLATLAHLALLSGRDPEWRALYQARAAHFDGLKLDGEEGAALGLNPDELRRRVLEAADRGHFDRIRQLTDSLPEKAAANGGGRLRAPLPRGDRIDSLAAPFPAAAARCAEELGLFTEVLPTIQALNGYLSSSAADRAESPAPAAGGTDRDRSAGAADDAFAPQVAPRLRENLDLLLGNPFITSAGNRYLPWFGAEALLLETFPESEPDARTPLLDRLRLEHRRGAARVSIEDALLTHGAQVVGEIGLDPVEFQLTCIPFDAYLRLAPKYGWGREELWTHFDGYQVTRQLQLWSMVGGHTRFGGAEDLCSLRRDYESDRLTARFAVVRRRRFLAREQAAAPR